MSIQTTGAGKVRRAGAAFLGWALSVAFSAPLALGQIEETGTSEASGPVRLVARRTGPVEAKVYAQLTNCTEVTLTLTLALTNAAASEQLPLTADSMGRTFFELVTIQAASPSGPWGYGGQFSWQYGRRGDAPSAAHVYELPYKHGPYLVTQSSRGETHTEESGSEDAIDWAMPMGTVICAARGGTVVALRQDSTVGVKDPKFIGSGNFIIIMHEDGTFAEYGHLKRKGAVVWLGQQVKNRDVIGFSGGTGYSSGPHLHFCVFQTVDGQKRRSLPVQFRTETGRVETLKAGEAY